jgi:multidrug efflux pump subunit AcrA (membrane-fusion protein)
VDEDEATSGLAARPIGSGPGRIHLFDPKPLLAVVVVLFWPLRYFPIVLIPAIVLAGLTAFKHWNGITYDLRRLFGEFSFVIHLLFSLLIVNLGARLSMGAVIRASGGAVRDFGLTFFLGFIPRLYVDRSAIPLLERNGQLWAYGAPLMVRLSYMVFGILTWATYRSSGTWLASFALLVSQVGLWAFLLATMPLLPGDGYNWLATYLGQPMLRRKALIVLNAKLGRRRASPIRRDKEPMLIIFALGSIVAIVAAVLVLFIIWGMLLIRHLQGVGAVLLLALVASFAMWTFTFKSRRAHRRRQKQEAHLLRPMMVGQTHVASSKSAQRKTAPPSGRWMRRLTIGTCAGVALTLVGFLPYSYDPAGPFKILATQRNEAIARSDGDVVEVVIREGDNVKAGQALARLSSSVQQRNVELTRKNLEYAEARLAQLEGKKSKFDQTTLEPVRGISAADMEREVGQDDVERLRNQLDYDKAELDRTTIRAPAAGVVTTPNVHLLTGVWLNAGDNFLQIDVMRAVEAEIEIAQEDIALVKPGAKVRLRPWSEGDREIVGYVTEVAPSALDKADKYAIREKAPLRHAGSFLRSAMTETEPAGENKADHSGVIRVKASAPNVETWLRPAMGGYAKISGQRLTVGEAYLRFFIRLLTIELWSWVP